MRGAHRRHRFGRACAVLVALVASVLTATPESAAALQLADVVINEIVAANDSFLDNFGQTPDWIELQNDGGETVDLGGWTIADNGGPWTFPSINLDPGERIVIFASGRDLATSPLHTDFSLKRAGEAITLANASGLRIDSVTYPALDDDISYGRGASGGIGVLLVPTPGQANTGLAPSSVTITTPPQTFQNSLSVSMNATIHQGEQVRYTTDSTPVTASSPVYSSPFSVTTSTVVRAAVVGNSAIGPESSAGYIAVSSSIADFSSDIPLVLVHSTGVVGADTQDAIVTVIDREANGRATVFSDADYTGFAGLRIRGATSANFPKKQYKFELWGDRFGDEVDAQLLDLGNDSDWALYAPGFYDRAMINNPLMYELGKRTGVLAPDYQFVELFIEDNPSATVGDGDYLGLYVLRETIKTGDGRVDITEHTDTSAGADGGYILRYDWDDDCCQNIGTTRYGSRIEVSAPKIGDLTSSQFSYIDSWWQDLEAASQASFSSVDQYIDFDSLIDHWLLEILAMDVDVLRASHYFVKDAGGQLEGGPLWDYDRALGGADSRVNSINEARAWSPNGSSGHSYDSDVYDDLWDMPEVQARLRARWAEWRQPGAVLSDSAIDALVFELGGEIQEAYTREEARWGSVSGYGTRYGDLNGELNHMNNWLAARTEWLDDQFTTSTSPPQLNLPTVPLEIQANTAVSYQVQASDSQAIVFAAAGLPEGLSIDSSTGRISGTVGYGDAYGTFPVQITVTDSGGAATTGTLTIEDPQFVDIAPSSIVLNEYNAVGPGKFLADGGTDVFFGTVGGNGGDWFEVVTIDDNLDLRGWTFDLFANNESGDVVQTASLVLGVDEQLAAMRAGSIITVAESVPDDLSYDPAADDWTINLQANTAQAGGFFANQTSFDTNHKKWRLVIRDAAGAIRGYIGGETEVFAGPQDLNVSSTEVLGLGVDPSALARTYVQGTESTFGGPNALASGGVQDFAQLRPQLVVMGDVDCDDEITIADALVVAQYSVGLRTDSGGCPVGDPTTELNAAASDVNGDAIVDVGDAITIAQCTVGLTNTFCPE